MHEIGYLPVLVVVGTIAGITALTPPGFPPRYPG